MKSFLIGLDGSALAESVLPYAEFLARSNGGEVILVRAILQGETIELSDDGLQPGDPIDRVTGDTQLDDPAVDAATFQEARGYLTQVGNRFVARGVGVHSLVVVGDPATVIVDEAVRHHADAIVLATHGRSGLGRWLYGSVAEAVLERSPLPVLLARAPRQRRELSEIVPKIVVPLDGSRLAETALPRAIELARAIGARLHLLRVVAPPHTYWAGEMPAFSYVSPSGIDDEERQAIDYLDELVQRRQAEGVIVKRSVRVDTAASAIVETVSDEDATLIVMATHGRTGLMRTLLGSVAMEVLHESPVPVLLVHPLKTAKAA